jgi:hypothetical protein
MSDIQGHFSRRRQALNDRDGEEQYLRCVLCVPRVVLFVTLHLSSVLL